MTFAMTANVRCTVEQRIQTYCETTLPAGTDSLDLQFTPTIWALS